MIKDILIVNYTTSNAFFKLKDVKEIKEMKNLLPMVNYVRVQVSSPCGCIDTNKLRIGDKNYFFKDYYKFLTNSDDNIFTLFDIDSNGLVCPIRKQIDLLSDENELFITASSIIFITLYCD